MATEIIENLRSLITQVQDAPLMRSRSQNPNLLLDGTNYTLDAFQKELSALLDKLDSFIDSELFESSSAEKQANIITAVKKIKIGIDQGNYLSVISHMNLLAALLERILLRRSAESRRELEDMLNEFRKENSEIQERQNRQIGKLFADAKEHKEIQQQISAAYKAKLAEYTKEQNEASKEAQNLIQEARAALQEAKAALEYKTAAGISAAFTERYNADKKWTTQALNFLWVLAAGIFVVGAIVGGYILLKENISVGAAIARIAVMSAATYAAWFCAARYARYTNIMEDYGYKAVLAKTLIAFHDYLNEDDKKWYLQNFMKEILQDPMRKRHDTEHPAEGIFRRITRPKKNTEEDQ